MLVLHRNDFSVLVEFHSIGASRDSEDAGGNFQVPLNPHYPPGLADATVHFLVQNMAFGGEEIFRPNLLCVDKSALAWAKL
jgi:hypothetical protein